MRILLTLVVGAAVGLTLTGCVAQQSLTMAGGIHLRLRDDTGAPAGLIINAKNTGTSDITVDRVTTIGTNLAQGKPWLLPADGKNTDTIGGLVTPFSADPSWSRREVVSRGRLEPGRYVAIVATVSFPYGGISAASISGVDVDYTTSDGSHHSAHSDVRARFSAHC